MSTTYNHSLVAASTAIPTASVPLEWKIAVLLALAVTHLALDAVPHWHWYDFAKLRQGLLGAAIELGIGLIILPFAIWLITDINLWRLGWCILAANLFDFLVGLHALKIIRFPLIYTLNHEAHKWEHDGRTPEETKIIWEITQIVLFATIFGLIVVWR